jgi:hypothetical protein
LTVTLARHRKDKRSWRIRIFASNTIWMTTNQLLYKAVLDNLRKDLRGEAVSVAEFNALLPVVSHEYFIQQYAKFQETQKITDSLAPFIKTATVTLTSGVGYLPVDYMHLIGTPMYLQAADTRKIDVVSRLEYAERVVDPITQPTAIYPIAILGMTTRTEAFGEYFDYGTNSYVRGIGAFAQTQIDGVNRPGLIFNSGYNFFQNGERITISGGKNNVGAASTGYDGTHDVLVRSDYPNNVCLPYVTYDNTVEYAIVSRSNVNTITVYPTTITSISVTYLCKPVTPKLDYYVTTATNVRTFLGEDETHTADTDAESYPVTSDAPSDGGTYTSETVEMEWGPQDRPSILAMILTKLGVTMGVQGVAELGVATVKNNDK